MRREHLMARLLRALSGKTQEQFGDETGIHPTLVAQYELGHVVPGRKPLERMAAAVRELAVVFGSKGVHREALAALRLFQEAAEQERATAELARRILGYLFRARHDPGLRFPS